MDLCFVCHLPDKKGFVINGSFLPTNWGMGTTWDYEGMGCYWDLTETVLGLNQEAMRIIIIYQLYGGIVGI